MSEQLLSTGDAAKRLGVSSESVRKYERLGKLNALRTVSGQRIFKASEVDGLVSQRASRRMDSGHGSKPETEAGDPD